MIVQNSCATFLGSPVGAWERGQHKICATQFHSVKASGNQFGCAGVLPAGLTRTEEPEDAAAALLRGAEAGCFCAQVDHFGNPLGVLLCICQLRELLLRHLVVVMLDALGVVRGDALNLRLNLGVFLGLARLEFRKLLLLAGFIRTEGLLSPGRVLEQIIGRGAGGIERHEHGGALDGVGDKLRMR